MTDELEKLTPSQELINQSLTLHPAIVEACTDDPDALVELTRAQLAVVQDRMVKRALQNVDTSIAQLATVHERLSKNAQIEKHPTGPAGAMGAQVIINFIRSPGRESVTIEGTAAKVPDANGPGLPA